MDDDYRGYADHEIPDSRCSGNSNRAWKDFVVLLWSFWGPPKCIAVPSSNHAYIEMVLIVTFYSYAFRFTGSPFSEQHFKEFE